MTPRKRFLTALHGKKTDRPPSAHVTALTTVELQKTTGCFMPEVHHNGAKMAKLLAANHQILGFDAVTFLINFFNAPAALGTEMDWGSPEKLPVFKSQIWNEPKDAIVPNDLLDRQHIKACLQALKIAKKDYGANIAVLGKVMGPLSMVQVTYGTENTMTDLILAPQKIKYFLDVAAEILIQFANAEFDAGIDAVSIGEGGAGANMLSPEMYEKILMPIHKKMISRINGPTIMHICGDITSRLGMLAETGLTCFNFDSAIDPKKMVQAAKGKFSVMGNINTVDLLNAGPEVISRQVIENIQAGVNIISPGCAVSPLCPNENFRVIAETIKKYNRDT